MNVQSWNNLMNENSLDIDKHTTTMYEAIEAALLNAEISEAMYETEDLDVSILFED